MLVPARADLVYDFLPVAWRTIQHYGVDLHGLRYDGAAVNGYRNRRSDFTGPRRILHDHGCDRVGCARWTFARPRRRLLLALDADAIDRALNWRPRTEDPPARRSMRLPALASEHRETLASEHRER